MPNGLTPYDKKVYRESKRRRKQALVASETGRIKPIRNRKKLGFIIVIIISVLAVVGVSLFFIFKGNDTSATQASTETTGKADAEFIIVNRATPLEKDYIPNLKKYGEFSVEVSAYSSLCNMLDDAKNQGIDLKITKAYVSFDEQKALYEKKLDEIMQDPNITEVRAEALARKSVAKAGESEFQTGLLVSFDISNSTAEAFLERNCVKYGFIQRYEEDKEDITGISADRSTYRFVGVESAVNMRSYNMCLEEYNSYQKTQNNR